LFGGIALANAGLGAVHGFAGPIGGMFSAPHGEICAALLPHVMKVNLRALREREPKSYAINRYYQVARILTGNNSATADAGIEWVQELVNDFKIPRLGAHGIKPDHATEIVKNAMNASSMKANPLKLTEAELGEILQSAI
jgi:alcohol dehydrogenase class IV